MTHRPSPPHRALAHPLAALLLSLCATAAVAQPLRDGYGSAIAPAGVLGPGWKVLFGLGLTAGGERLVTSFAGSTWSGALLHLHTGVRWEPQPWLSMQLGVGLHLDSTDANATTMLIETATDQRNRDYVRFERYPVEALMHLRLSEQWAVGGGWRRAYGPALRGEGAYRDFVVSLQSRPAGVAELEYRFGTGAQDSYAAVVLRGVREHYLTAGGARLRADHGGLYLNVWF